MTVVQNEATLSEKRWPGTGSSPKTAGSQSNDSVLAPHRHETYLCSCGIAFYPVYQPPTEQDGFLCARSTVDQVALLTQDII